MSNHDHLFTPDEATRLTGAHVEAEQQHEAPQHNRDEPGPTIPEGQQGYINTMFVVPFTGGRSRASVVWGRGDPGENAPAGMYDRTKFQANVRSPEPAPERVSWHVEKDGRFVWGQQQAPEASPAPVPEVFRQHSPDRERER